MIILFLIAVSMTIAIVACKDKPPIYPDYQSISNKFQLAMNEAYPLIELKDVKNEIYLGAAIGKPTILYRSRLIKQNEYLFEVNKYAYDLGAEFTSGEGFSNICNNIETARTNAKNDVKELAGNLDKISKAISSWKIKMPIGEAGVSSLLDLSTIVLQSFAIPGHVKVFVRGFADRCQASDNCAISNLITAYNKKYYYQEILVHPFAGNGDDLGNNEVDGYKKSKEKRSSSDGHGKYENQHLPNLRAQFFIDRFLTNLADRCSLSSFSKDEDIGILEGRVNTTVKDTPEARKVEVYIAIYPESLSQSLSWESIKSKLFKLLEVIGWKIILLPGRLTNHLP
jgi:hypothetical protein